MSVSVEGPRMNLEKQKNQRLNNIMFVSPKSLEFVPVDTQDNMEGQTNTDR